jgi:hypothetical protein
MQAPQSFETFTAEVAQIDAVIAPIAKELGLTRCTGSAS